MMHADEIGADTHDVSLADSQSRIAARETGAYSALLAAFRDEGTVPLETISVANGAIRLANRQIAGISALDPVADKGSEELLLRQLREVADEQFGALKEYVILPVTKHNNEIAFEVMKKTYFGRVPTDVTDPFLKVVWNDVSQRVVVSNFFEFERKPAVHRVSCNGPFGAARVLAQKWRKLSQEGMHGAGG